MLKDGAAFKAVRSAVDLGGNVDWAVDWAVYGAVDRAVYQAGGRVVNLAVRRALNNIYSKLELYLGEVGHC